MPDAPWHLESPIEAAAVCHHEPGRGEASLDGGTGTELDQPTGSEVTLYPAGDHDLLGLDPCPDLGVLPHLDAAYYQHVTLDGSLQTGVSPGRHQSLEASALGYQRHHTDRVAGSPRHQPSRIREATRWRSSGPK